MPAFSKLADVPARAILGGAVQGRYMHVDAMTIGEVLLNPNTSCRCTIIRTSN
jgi:hypothetical protein